MPRLSRRSLASRLALALILAGSGPFAATAQDWGSEDDDWSSRADRPRAGLYADTPASTPWSLRAGMGFTVDPNDFLLNFELPYRFDRYVSAGPMIQIGLEDRRYIVAPTLNVGITLPDMPGDQLDRFHPNIFMGIGFAVIENDDRGGGNRDSGFLVNAGFGIDYQLSERLAIGSRMILNFLPGGTLDEKFFYSWEVGGVKFSF